MVIEEGVDVLVTCISSFFFMNDGTLVVTCSGSL